MDNISSAVVPCDTSAPQPDEHEIVCTLCQPPRSFGALKTLRRHIRTLHQPSVLKCSFCSEVFNRKDIKDRHEREQHSGLTKKTHCASCNKWIHIRALDDHLKSQGHGQAEDQAADAVCAVVRQLTGQIPTESLIDPFLLTTQLYIEADPMGSGPESWTWVKEPFTPSSQVLTLLGLALRITRKRMSEDVISAPRQLILSIGVLAVVTTMIGGWNASADHRKMMIHLENKFSLLDVDWFNTQTWPDAWYSEPRTQHVRTCCLHNISALRSDTRANISHGSFASSESLDGLDKGIWLGRTGDCFSLNMSYTRNVHHAPRHHNLQPLANEDLFMEFAGKTDHRFGIDHDNKEKGGEWPYSLQEPRWLVSRDRFRRKPEFNNPTRL